MSNPVTVVPESDVALLDTLRKAHKKMRAEVGKIIIGQEKVLDELLMAIFCRGHALLVGVPGASWETPRPVTSFMMGMPHRPCYNSIG